MWNKLGPHLRRLQYQLGKVDISGSRQFVRRGYTPSRLAAWENLHEPHLRQLMSQLLETRPGTFIDIGVNTGQTLMKVLQVDPNRQYLGFEPQIACCFEIEQFVKANELDNVVVLPLALSNDNALLTIYSRGLNDDEATVVSSIRQHKYQFKTIVPSRRGDEIISELRISEICAVKIDVEGAELEVLQGLEGTVKSRRPPILFEVLPNYYGVKTRTYHSDDIRKIRHERARELLKYFENLNYQINLVQKNGDLKWVRDFALDDRSGREGSDFLAIPN